jgi:hypothetical protein
MTAVAILGATGNPRPLLSQKAMHGGKGIARGDVIFVFASENDGGSGLVARGIVTSAEALLQLE